MWFITWWKNNSVFLTTRSVLQKLVIRFTMFSVKSLKCCLVTIYENSGGYIMLSEAACVSLFDKYTSDHQTTLSITENSGNLSHWFASRSLLLVTYVNPKGIDLDGSCWWTDITLAWQQASGRLTPQSPPQFPCLEAIRGQIPSMFLPCLSLCKYFAMNFIHS